MVPALSPLAASCVSEAGRLEQVVGTEPSPFFSCQHPGAGVRSDTWTPIWVGGEPGARTPSCTAPRRQSHPPGPTLHVRADRSRGASAPGPGLSALLGSPPFSLWGALEETG